MTALEDVLQESVKECIEDFKRAKIKVWMLTGDKGETAHNIGITCGIIDPQEINMAIEGETTEALENDIVNVKKAMN